MARYTAEQIYAFAREAGFSPDRAATMTAVAMAESGGRSDAHNPSGEDSRGLWQINVRAHPELGQGDLYDPVQNARAAFAVSNGGEDISPWTTTHGGMSARYLRYRAQAEAAAAAYGDGPGRGMWEGTAGYGDHTSAGDGRGAGQPTPGHSGSPATGSTSGSDNVNVSSGTPGTETATGAVHPGEDYGIALDSPTTDGVAGGTPAPDAHAGEDYGIALDGAPSAPEQTPETPVPAGGGDPDKLHTFLNAAVAQTGDQYVFGHEVDLNDPNPSTFDCSELVEWASAQAGVDMPDGSWLQYQTLAQGGHAIPVEQAINTPGALLFSFSSDPMAGGGRPSTAHVAISLGNGKTIEAKGTQYGVGSWDATPKRFQYAAVIPELAGSPDGTAVSPAPTGTPTATDGFDYRVNHDPVNMDNHPATVAASHALTAAEPGPAGIPYDQPTTPEPAAVLGDLDHDGMDDALQHASEFAADPVHDHDTGLSDLDHHHADDHHADGVAH